MVAAAFIGPGTVTTAATAGANSGLTLAWAVLFSVLATVVLQELSVRSALSTQRDLADLARSLGGGCWGRGLIALLIVVAVGVGNAAYQSGNLSGAALGLSVFFPEYFSTIVAALSILAGGLLLTNRYRYIERVLVALVVVMAGLFLALAVLLLPELMRPPAPRLLPRFDDFELTLVLALIGTTIVPYNLFLHATAARRRWQGVAADRALAEARQESWLAISVGGLITLAVMAVATVLLQAPSDQPILQLLMSRVELYLPGWGARALAVGLFAAGFTSAIAAPLAAAWAVTAALGQPSREDHWAFKLVAVTVMVVGALLAITASKPEALILTAQATNALLLPVVAIILLAVANSRLLPEAWRNTRLRNGLAVVVISLVLLLAAKKLLALIP